MTERLRGGRPRGEDVRPARRGDGLLARGARAAARRAALGLADGAGRGSSTRSSRELAPHLEEGDTIVDGGNSNYSTTCAAPSRAARAGAPLRRRRRQRRRLGPRARLLPDGRRRRRGGRAARSRSSRRSRPASTRPDARRPRRRSGARGAGLAPLRPERRGPLREDGPQRDRVRADAGVRRGVERAQAREHRHARAGDRRGDDAAARPRPLQVRARPRGDRRSSGATARSSRPGCSTWPRRRCTSRRTSTTTPAASSDSGEGRWTVQAAVEEGVPVPVLAASLFDRFASRGEADWGDRVLSAMRKAFGGHLEKSPEQ